MHLLIKWATRGRPQQFFEALSRYKKCLVGDDYSIVVSIDSNDQSMNCKPVLERLRSESKLTFFVGNSENKVQAINANMDGHRFDILMLASDDMIPQIKGFNLIIEQKFHEHHPDLDGVLWFFDGNRKDLNTLSIMGRKYYERFGYIYYPEYICYWCDAEFTEVSRLLNKVTYIDTCIVKHEHPEWNDSVEMDQTYTIYRNPQTHKHDEELYKKRASQNFSCATGVLSGVEVVGPDNAEIARLRSVCDYALEAFESRRAEVYCLNAEHRSKLKALEEDEQSRMKKAAAMKDEELSQQTRHSLDAQEWEEKLVSARLTNEHLIAERDELERQLIALKNSVTMRLKNAVFSCFRKSVLVHDRDRHNSVEGRETL